MPNLNDVERASGGTPWMGWPVLVHSARTAVAAVVSVLVARLFRLPETYWAPITTLVITQSSLGAALQVSWQRFLGTVLGAIAGAIIASRFGSHLLTFGASVFILGVVLRRAAVRSKRLSLCGRYGRRCAVGPANQSCMANRLSSVRRSVYRHWGGADIGLDVAG